MLEAILVPIFICVVLPVSIVWIVFRSTTERNRQKSQIILEALKNNPDVDTNKLLESFNNPPHSSWEQVSRKLLRGCIFSLIGISFILYAIFFPDEAEDYNCWIVGGISLSVGIAFLITGWFTYRHIDKFDNKK